MDRRRFIGGLGGGLLTLGLAGCGLRISGASGEIEENSNKTPGNKTTPAAASGYDRTKLVVAEGTDPNSLIEKGLNALGGIGQLVKKGSSVVIKPNFSVPRKPEEAATTSPLLVAALVKLCLAAGAKEVKVIDYPFGGPLCLTNSGIKAAVEAAGGQ